MGTGVARRRATTRGGVVLFFFALFIIVLLTMLGVMEVTRAKNEIRARQEASLIECVRLGGAAHDCLRLVGLAPP